MSSCDGDENERTVQTEVTCARADEPVHEIVVVGALEGVSQHGHTHRRYTITCIPF